MAVCSQVHTSYLSLSFTRAIQPRHRSGLYRGETSPPLWSSFPPATIPSADFSHAVKVGCPAFSRFTGTWETSRGKHMPFSTWMPGLRIHPIMDRGLYLVVQARPGVCASYPISVGHPVLLWCPASAGRLPSEVSSPVPRCHTTTPFASIRLGLRLAKCIEILKEHTTDYPPRRFSA